MHGRRFRRRTSYPSMGFVPLQGPSPFASPPVNRKADPRRSVGWPVPGASAPRAAHSRLSDIPLEVARPVQQAAPPVPSEPPTEAGGPSSALDPPQPKLPCAVGGSP